MEENNQVSFVSQWMTIQPLLFDYLDDDSHGGKFARVRGRAKVLLHLMFGLIVIAAEQIYSNGLLT